jgi:hypothetical protein
VSRPPRWSASRHTTNTEFWNKKKEAIVYERDQVHKKILTNYMCKKIDVRRLILKKKLKRKEKRL